MKDQPGPERQPASERRPAHVGRIRRWLPLAVRVAGLVTAAAVAYVVLTFVLVLSASRQDHRGPAEAIIVLGAAQYDGTPSPVLRARLDHTVELWQEDAADLFVVTGGKQEGDRFTEAAASYTYLRQLGVPERLILREEQGTNTWEQLAAATRILRGRGVGSAVLVSDDYHAYRLSAIADELGFEVDVSPVDAGLSFGGEARALGRETVAVAVGRIIGFRRLMNLDDSLSEVRDGG